MLFRLDGRDGEQVDETYQRAIKTINPRRAMGSFAGLFIAYAKFFEEGGVAEEKAEPDLESARKVFEKAVTVPFKRVDDLAEIWCEWAEMEVRNEFVAAAVSDGFEAQIRTGITTKLYYS